MVDVYVNHNSRRSITNLSSLGCDKPLSTENVNKQLDEYKNYLVEQKGLIKKIHQQQKKLKSFRNSSRASNSMNSRSCYSFQMPNFSLTRNQNLNANKNNGVCSQSFYVAKSQLERKKLEHSNSMTNLEWYYFAKVDALFVELAF